MTVRTLASLTALTIVFAACGGGEQQQTDATPEIPAPTTEMATPAAMPTSQMPAGVTAEMVAEGNTLFHGAGICMTCHGQDAKGVPGLGVNLTDQEWLHSDGSYEAIVNQIMKGVTATESKTGVAMPAKGGSAITDEQVKAVAAYVYSLRG
ncbi:MAG: c-type cytochrome [Gemmatimonadota bacterium]|nr:c-type cytochrome [Gemmatimonadota bacterium]MDH4350079.1 c-type cytochrome [Gemmatimonadota bacterium]MDH5198885.1 c-type cytochrome [Gemmatimonadota bacterium]